MLIVHMKNISHDTCLLNQMPNCVLHTYNDTEYVVYCTIPYGELTIYRHCTGDVLTENFVYIHHIQIYPPQLQVHVYIILYVYIYMKGFVYHCNYNYMHNLSLYTSNLFHSSLCI